MNHPSPNQDTAAALLAEGQALRGLARSLLARDDAEDLLQDGYLAALAQPGAARRLGPWLSGTLRRLAARWRRRTLRQGRREQAVARADHDDENDPAAIAAQSEAARLLVAAVHALEEPFRTVVVLRFWHGALPTAIAQRLGVPVNTVRSRLQRALARLRTTLDEHAGRRNAWVGALAGLIPPPNPPLLTSGSAMTAIATVMTNKVLVCACLVVAALVVLPFAWPVPPLPPTSDDVAAAPSTAAKAISPPGPGEGTTPSRVTPDTQQPTAGPQGVADALGSAPVVPPWTMRFVVVDEDGKPVPAATVWIWPGQRHRAGVPGIPGNAYSGRTDEVLARLLTDQNGKATAIVDREQVCCRADKEPTQSTEHHHSHAQTKPDVQLVLRPRIPIAGRVVHVDGTPAARAKVTVIAKGIDTRTLGAAPAPPAALADDAGRFHFELLADFAYELHAIQDEARSFTVDLRLARTPPPELVLTFPGAITLRGTVVDANGRPVRGASVRIWSDGLRADVEHRAEAQYLRTDRDGKFSTALRAHGRYGAMASADEQPRSEVAFVETSPAQPHAELRLVVPHFDTIRGQVKKGDGTPLANALIHAEGGPITFAATAEPSPRERHATGGEVALDAEGRFALRVQPGTTWTLVVTPRRDHRPLSFRREGIRSGTDDVLIVASDGELAGCTIRGRVIDPTGQPLTAYDLTISEMFGQHHGSTTRNARITAEGFQVPPIAVGKTIHVRITPTDRNLTPRVFGPFVTSADGITIDARVGLCGTLPVRVCESDGTPARAVSVTLGGSPPGEPSFGPSRVGADGCVRLTGRMPGTRLLLLSRDVTPIHEQEVVVLPGPNPEVVITLPAAPTKTPR